MLNGKIIKVLESKGYGFIQCEENGMEYFYHFSMLTRIPKIGDNVRFEPSENNAKGPRCKSVEYVK